MRKTPRRFGFLLLLTLACAAVPLAASAQTLEAPLTVHAGSINPIQLATGRDGSVLELGSPASGTLVTCRYPNALPNPNTPTTLPAIAGTGLTALPHGGFAAIGFETIRDPFGLYKSRTVAQRLSPSGEPTGPPVPVGEFIDALGRGGIAPLGDGFVIGFFDTSKIVGQRFDATGTKIGPSFSIASQPSYVDTKLAAVPGGFLAVWGRDLDTNARLFAADLTPLTPPFVVASSFEFTGLAVNPAGTLAAIVGKPHDGDASPNDVRLRFFDPNGSSVGSDIVVGSRTQDTVPDVASDPGGNFLVVWGPGIQARAYDGSGATFGPAVTFGALGVFEDVKVIGRREGGFFAVRTGISAGSTKTYVARVTLCTAGSAVCGDGTLVPTCEVCDAGAGNSNAAPDACRTNCRPWRCGDGTLDSDEECDDGNGANCDGCTELCELETGTLCGDGIPAPPGCGEACDDANTIAGDGCSSTCEVEHVFGGGKAATDCYATWRIDNPSNDPRFDKHGSVNPTQRCRDNDSACDFDGGVVGSCTFHLAVCVNNSEPAACVPSRLRSWTLLSPSAKQALGRPPLAAVRAALDAAVLPTVVGSSDPDRCSPNADIVVPLRGMPGAFKANKLKLKARAEIYSGAIDGDGLSLRCDP